MTAPKELKFEFILDQNSFQRIKRAIQDLTSEMQKFVKASQGTSMGGFFGGANVGRPQSAAGTVVTGAAKAQSPIGQVIADNANAFKNIAQLGTASLKGLTDALKRSVAEQTREVRGLQAALDALGRTYANMGGAQGTHAGALQSKMAQVAGRLTNARSGLATSQGMLPPSNLLPGVPYPPGSPGGPPIAPPGGAGGPPTFFGGSIKGVFPESGAGMLRMGGVIAGGIMAAIKEGMAGSRIYSSVESGRSDLVTGEVRRLRGGDITRLVARQDMLRDRERRDDLESQVGRLAGAEALGSGIIGAGKSLIGLQGGGLAGSLSDLEKSKYENYQNQVKSYEDSATFLPKRLALERFMGDFDSRVSTGRVLGLGLSRKVSSRLTGLGSVAGFGGMGLGTNGADTYTLSEAALHRQGYSNGQLAGAVQQSRALGMGGGYAGEIMGASAMGWGGWGDIRANAARGGNAGLALSALGATPNTAAGMQIGQMAFGYDPRGTTSGIGLMNAIQGGGFNFNGGVGDMNMAARIQAGLGGGDAMARGFDPYQQGRNLVSAIHAAPGMGTYAQDYLANGMSFKQLLDSASGNMTETGRNLGLTSGMARSQIGGMAGSVFERYVDQGENNSTSRAIRAFRKSGKGLPEFLSTADASTRSAMGTYLGSEIGLGEEAGLGAIGLLSGVDNRKLKNGRVPMGGLGEAEKSRLGAEADQMVKDARILGDSLHQIKASFEAIPDEIKAQVAWASNLNETAKVFTDSLHNLADTINDTVTQIRTGQPAAPRSSDTKAGATKKSLVDSGAIPGKTKNYLPNF